MEAAVAAALVLRRRILREGWEALPPASSAARQAASVGRARCRAALVITLKMDRGAVTGIKLIIVRYPSEDWSPQGRIGCVWTQL